MRDKDKQRSRETANLNGGWKLGLGKGIILWGHAESWTKLSVSGGLCVGVYYTSYSTSGSFNFLIKKRYATLEKEKKSKWKTESSLGFSECQLEKKKKKKKKENQANCHQHYKQWCIWDSSTIKMKKLHFFYSNELKTYIHIKTRTQMFVAAVFLIAKTWKQPGYPSIGE